LDSEIWRITGFGFKNFGTGTGITPLEIETKHQDSLENMIVFSFRCRNAAEEIII